MNSYRGTAKVPGSCGELVQGTIDGRPFLVTCPVDLYAMAVVTLYPGEPGRRPAGTNPKAAGAVETTLQFLGRPGWGYDLEIKSDIPRGKGMSSSTADVAAVSAAVFRACGLEPAPERVAELAAAIEPTDGVMFPGIVVFDHLTGKPVRQLGTAPKIELLVADLGGEVDTLRFNRRADLAELNRRKEPLARRALEMAERAIGDGDPELLGQAATLSALAHQEILPKPDLPGLLAVARDFGSVGVSVGHSGTVVGMMFRPGSLEARVVETIKRHWPEIELIQTRLIGGGIG